MAREVDNPDQKEVVTLSAECPVCGRQNVLYDDGKVYCIHHGWHEVET